MDNQKKLSADRLTQEELRIVDQALIGFYMAGLQKKDRTESIIALHIANKLYGDERMTVDEIFEILDK